MATPQEVAAMRRAVVLAGRGGLRTWPNPPVGAVVLDAAGEVAGEGWHARAGEPHAEVAALAAAGARAHGGTVVVTLEPCAHTGRTPPCTAALRAAGVRRVVFGVADPTEAAGGGGAALAASGLSVAGGVLAPEAAAATGRWLVAARGRRPVVTWKYAATLDGRVAAADGTSRWVSGPAARAEVHRLRADSDAILVGVGTVLTDDPQLTVRDPAGTPPDRPPLRVVVDSRGRTPAAARVRDGAAPTWVATVGEVGAGPDGRVDLAALLAGLHRRGCRTVLVEGGPTLAAAFLRADLVDRVVAYLAPRLLGAGAPAVGDLGIGTLAAARPLVWAEVDRVGVDVRLVAAVPTAPSVEGSR